MRLDLLIILAGQGHISKVFVQVERLQTAYRELHYKMAKKYKQEEEEVERLRKRLLRSCNKWKTESLPYIFKWIRDIVKRDKAASTFSWNARCPTA